MTDGRKGGEGLSVLLSQSQPMPLDVAFDCAPGEVLALFGPSGSGKTTTLRAIAGLHRPARGRVVCNGEVWFDSEQHLSLPPHRRAAGLVFQEYALFPHLNVLGNVIAAMSHRPRGERLQRARELLALVRLQGLEERRSSELSGGQRQRVALARALARDPAVLLLDEPFAAVDRAVRQSLYAELEVLRQSLRMPLILVTHDFEEVARFADTLVLIEQGRVVARGRVTELTSRIDIPQLIAQYEPGNIFDARVEEHDAGRRLTRLSFDGGYLWSAAIGAAAGERLRIRIPAREIALATSIPEGISVHNVLAGVVSAIAPANDPALNLVVVRVGSTSLVVQVTYDAVSRLALTPGRAVHALIKSVAVLRPASA